MSIPVNYALQFEPNFKERIWGGRRLESLFGKRLPPEKPIGESWEISDHGHDVSVIANGPWRGRSLHDVLMESAHELFGDVAVAQRSRPGTAEPRFPLLVKWIDAQENLSIQVHPPDGHARLPRGERGKHECWFVVSAEPGAEIYLGLRRGIDRAAFIRELARGTVARCLNVFPARPGDSYFVPAGTPHAIGAGVLLAEIQQSSDTTFRLFDWNRVDPATGRPRDLQIEPALACIDFQMGPPVVSNLSSGTACRTTTLLSLDRCPHFSVHWRRVSSSQQIGDAGRATVIICLSGCARLTGGGHTVEFKAGDCGILPAAGRFTCEAASGCEFLEARIGN